MITDVQPGQRPDTIHPLRVTESLDEWELEVGPRFRRFGDDVEVMRRVDLVFEHMAAVVAEAQVAIVVFERAIGLHQTHEVRIETCELFDLLQMIRLILLQQIERETGMPHCFGQTLAHLEALGFRERFVHAAGHRKVRVNLATTCQFDYLLTELAKSNPAPGNVRVLLDKADNVALRGVAVPTEQQVRRAEVEETQGVRLRDLAHVQQLAQQFRRTGNFHAQDRVAGFRTRQQMAYGTDTADARGNLRHLGEAAPFAEFFEPAKLDHGKSRIRYLARLVEMNRDLRVSLDARNGVDGDDVAVGVSHNSKSSRPNSARGRPVIP